MLVDSTRLKCKREWKQIITYPLQKFFHGCIVISQLLTFEIKTCPVTTFSNFSAIHPTGLSSKHKRGLIMASNGRIYPWRHLAPSGAALAAIEQRPAAPSTSLCALWDFEHLGHDGPSNAVISCLKVICLEVLMWWVLLYPAIPRSTYTVGRPKSQRDFVDSNKTSRVIRYSWPLKPHDVAGYDHRAACPFLMLIVIILLIITLTSVQAILGRLAFSLLLFLMLVYHLKKYSMV